MVHKFSGNTHHRNEDILQAWPESTTVLARFNQTGTDPSFGGKCLLIGQFHILPKARTN